MAENLEGTECLAPARRGFQSARAFLTACSILTTMIVWTIGVSIPIEWRWCGSAHIWARTWM